MVLALGVDIGTSSLKLGAVDVETGLLAGWAGSEYHLQHPQPGWSELDAECYWEAFKSSLAELKKTADLKQIRAISVSSQAQTFVPVDREGKILQRAWTWIDNRAAADACELTQTLTEEKIFAVTGCEGVSPGSLPSMLKYLRKNNPGLISQTWKFLVTSSFLMWRLCGRTVMDENVAAMSGMYDWHQKNWWPEMLNAVGIDEKLLPEVLPSGTAAEKINPKIAEDIGLSSEVLIVTGGNDQTANALGAGLVDEQEILIVLGTALVVFRVLEKDKTPVTRGIWSPYPIAGRSYQLGYTNSGCGTLDWARQLVAPESKFPELFEKAAGVPIGSDGVTCLIDLDGRAGAENSDYRGMLAGLSRKTDRWCVLRAVLEGVTFSVQELAGDLKWDLAGKDVRTVGGGARSDLWLQIHADVLNSNIRRLDHEQSGVVGGAIMAAVGANLFSNYEEAVKKIVRLSRNYQPDPAHHAAYEKVYERFCQLRNAGNLFHGVNDV
jgi:xylulokinase